MGPCHNPDDAAWGYVVFRMKRALVPSLLVVGVALVLASCSNPGGGNPSYTSQDTAAGLNAAATDAQTVANAAVNGPGMAAIGGLFNVGSLLGGSSLPTGSYVWNPSTYHWDTGTVATSHDLRLQWGFDIYTSTAPPTSHTAVAQIDWIASTTVNGQELPTHMTASLNVDGAPAGNFDLSGTWQSTSCGTIVEPATVNLTGTLGTSTNQVKVNSLKLSIPSGSGTLSTTGDVTATAGGKTMSVKWDVSVDGATVRDATTCALTSFAPTGGSLSLGLTGPSNAVSLAFDVSNVQLTQYGGLTSADISNGSLKIDNALAASFQGTLDDANHDGTMGDNLTVTFKDGAHESLEQFIQSPEFSTFDLKPVGQLALPLLGLQKLY